MDSTNTYEEHYPTEISIEKYENDMQEKELEILDLQDLLKKSDDELEESKEIIKYLKKELMKYEKISKK